MKRVAKGICFLSAFVFGFSSVNACLKPQKQAPESTDSSAQPPKTPEKTSDNRAFPPGLVRKAYLQALAGNDGLLREAFWLPTLSQLSAKLTFTATRSANAKAAVQPAYEAVVALKKKNGFSALEFHNTIAFSVCALERALGTGSRLDLEKCHPSHGNTPETVEAFPRYISMANQHPRVVVVPTFSNLSLKDFDEIAGIPVVFAGLTIEPSLVIDGKKMSPRSFFDHDLAHGQHWTDGSTNLFPTQGALSQSVFEAKLAQRIAEREAYLIILSDLRARLQREHPVKAFFRRALSGTSPASDTNPAPLSPLEKVDAFDFYVFHELRIETASEPGLVPCLESCWSIPGIFRMVREELGRSTLTSRIGRPLALLGFQSESEATSTLSQLEAALAAHLKNFPTQNTRPEEPSQVLGRFRSHFVVEPGSQRE